MFVQLTETGNFVKTFDALTKTNGLHNECDDAGVRLHKAPY